MADENVPQGGQGGPGSPNPQTPPTPPPYGQPPPYAGAPPPGYYGRPQQPMGISIRDVSSFISISRIFFLLGAIILFLVAIYSLIAAALLFSLGDTLSGGGSLASASVDIILCVIAVIGFSRTRDIQNMVNAGNYTDAASSSLVWGILGLFAGLVIGGVLLILAYLRLREASHMAPAHGQPGQGPATGTSGSSTTTISPGSS